MKYAYFSRIFIKHPRRRDLTIAALEAEEAEDGHRDEAGGVDHQSRVQERDRAQPARQDLRTTAGENNTQPPTGSDTTVGRVRLGAFWSV